MGDEGGNLEREIESESCGGSEGVAMDTPERKQINTPVSKFEDSPVFNYLNNLSPIQPVKSIHISQTFNPLAFASVSSIFTSPHVSSAKESRFLRRHQSSDPSKTKSSENENKVCNHEEIVKYVHKSPEKQQNFDRESSAGEAPAKRPYVSSLANELSRNLSYKCVSPDYNPSDRSGEETKCLPELSGSLTELVPYVHIDSGNCSLGSQVHAGGISEIDENKEISGCEWENMLSDATDFLVFDSPNDSNSLKDSNQKLVEPGTNFCTSVTDDLQNTKAMLRIGLSQQYESDTSLQHEDMKEKAEDQEILVSLSNCEAGDTCEKVDDELASNLHRGVRRRCLIFEMAGSRIKRLNDNSNSGPSMLSHSHDNIASSDKSLISIKCGSDSQRCILPGIGLHLNALASTPVNHTIVKHEALVTGNEPKSESTSAACLNSSSSQAISNSSLVLASSERDLHPSEDEVAIVDISAQVSEHTVNEVFSHSSPKFKRLESGGENEACKRCNCKKSKCLKLYCECFAAGVYCVEPCSCQECFNKPIHEDTVLATRKQIESRNPLAFAPKVIRSSDSIIEIGEESSKTPASARHKRGCNCKKSGCLKKYCECYQGGVGCSINCRCEGCKNAFGRKDGSTLIVTEVEFEEEQVDECERSMVDRNLQIITVPNDSEQNATYAFPATPLQFGSQSIQLSSSSKSKKPPRSFMVTTGLTSGIHGGQRLGKLNPTRAKLEKHVQTMQEEEMPEALQRSGSPNNIVKSTSPNNKRVSPPQCSIKLSPGQKRSRKLILQSIPSFPSLTSNH